MRALPMSRFEMASGGAVARFEYRREGDRIALTHTQVPEVLSGQGIGSKLLQGTVEASVRTAGGRFGRHQRGTPERGDGLPPSEAGLAPPWRRQHFKRCWRPPGPRTLPLRPCQRGEGPPIRTGQFATFCRTDTLALPSPVDR